MATILNAVDEGQVREAVAWGLSNEVSLDVRGAGSKLTLGRPCNGEAILDLSGLSGISLYEPEELILTAAAATPLADIDAALAGHSQSLAFEPVDYGELLGVPPGTQTIGGVIGCNLSGPRRIKAGAARDHFLGVKAVSGRGEIFKAGGRVVKNVTGYDICKLLAGSYGTLAVMTDVTLKVLPAPEKTRTVLAFGLDDQRANGAMIAALQSPFEVSAAAHYPVGIARASAVRYVAEAGVAVTALRLEGPAPSVVSRCSSLRALLASAGEIEELHTANSQMLWREVGDVLPLAVEPRGSVWRISVPPSVGWSVANEIARGHDAKYFFDRGGGLVWLAVADAADAAGIGVRAAVKRAHGHATLIRAPSAIRAEVSVFEPQTPELAALTGRVKDSFDPRHILNPGRMYADF